MKRQKRLPSDLFMVAVWNGSQWLWATSYGMLTESAGCWLNLSYAETVARELSIEWPDSVEVVSIYG